MKRWILRIKLESDFCTATGEDTPGIVNMVTATEDGVPYIPAKRIKGCLLEAGREMRDNGIIEPDELEHVFGKTGAQQGEGISLTDAHVYSVPKFLFGEHTDESKKIEDYELFQTEVKKCTETEQAYLEDFFTRQRTRTAIDADTKTAKKHSLRTMQVVPKGIEFAVCIEGELSEKGEAVLLDCVKGLRHMGIGITRGFGEVRCTLEHAPSEDSAKIDDRTKKCEELLGEIEKNYGQAQETVLSYEITLDSPIAIDGEDDCLPGDPVLGALAGMYIRKNSLKNNAHKDENFRRIFLHDGVQFGYGFLKKEDKIYHPCPKAIAEKKEKKGQWFQIAEGMEDERKKEIQGQVYWEGNKLHTISAQREIHFHHSRPINRGIAHALNDRAEDTSVPTGQFFQYKALSKGQTYAGTWIGTAKDLSLLLECLRENSYRMKLGRSKTAEYGNCTVRIADVSVKVQKPETARCGKKWMLWFLSPLVCRNADTGEYIPDKEILKQQLETKLGCKVKELKMAAGGYTTHSGYNGRWRMPLVSCPALETGSTFILETDDDVCDFEIEAHRWGELTGRGCGQAAARPFAAKEHGEIVKDQESKNCEKNRTESGKEDSIEEIKVDSGKLISEILDFQKKQWKSKNVALKEVEIVNAADLPPSSAIAMLSQLLRSYAGEDNFYEKICDEVKQIHNEQKKARISKFLEPCKGKTYEFMRLYLENAKWKARLRDRDE